MFCLNHRSIKVTLFSEIHIKIILKISLTYHQIASYNFKPQIIDFWTFSLNSYLITSAKVHEHSLYQVLNS